MPLVKTDDDVEEIAHQYVLHLDHTVCDAVPLVLTDENGGPAVTACSSSFISREFFPTTVVPLPPLTWQAPPPPSLLSAHAFTAQPTLPSTMDPSHLFESFPPTTPFPEERSRQLSRCHHLSVPEPPGPAQDQNHCSCCNHLLCVHHLLHLEGEHRQPGRCNHSVCPSPGSP